MSAHATVRFYQKHVSVLCPLGHLVEGRALDWDFGGSAFEAELAAHAAGLPNRFDRQAEQCNGFGHERRAE